MAKKNEGIKTWKNPQTGEVFALWHSIPKGAPVSGLAPIGIPWGGVKTGPDSIRPEKGCPAREFAVTRVRVDGDSLPIIVDPVERVMPDGKVTWHGAKGLRWTGDELRELLGGWVEAVYVPGEPDLVALVDEEGRIRGLPENPAASARCVRTLVGPVLFAPRRVWS